VSRSAIRALLLAAATLVVVYALLAWSGALNDRPPSSPTVSSTGPTGTGAASSSPGGTQAGASRPAPTAGATGAIATGTIATTTPVAVLVGAGDIADCASTGDEATAALLRSIDGTVFTLGDNVYENGTADEFARCYAPSWGHPSILERTRPVAGNHDYNSPDARPYFEYFGAPAGSPGEGWYAYDHGGWRAYVLNSNCAQVGGCGEGSAQVRWLRGDLAANPRRCAVAMWHHPRFSSGEHGDDNATAALWRTLQESGAELVLVGHDHHYERFAPQTASGEADPGRGLVQFVVGTGGRRLYDIRNVRANSVVRENETHGVLRLRLAPDSWSFDFIPVAGRTFTDSGSGTCH
jgi:hypothetical protein